MIYFDYAGSTPVREELAFLYSKINQEAFANPSSTHRYGQKSKEYLELSRYSVAQLLGVKSNQVYFLSTATEANNLAIIGLIEEFNFNNKPILSSPKTAQQQKQPHVLVSAIEHDSVLSIAKKRNINIAFKTFPVKENGIVDINDIISRIEPETILISLMLVNNEIGTIQPVADLSKILVGINIERQKQGLTRVYLHSDCVQAPLFLSVNIADLGVDFMTLSGHKMYSHKGTALLYIKNNIKIEPQVFGGGQENTLRSGTQNVASIVCFAKALELAQANKNSFSNQLKKIRDYGIVEIKKSLPEAILNGYWLETSSLNNSQDLRIANNINFSFPHFDQQSLLTFLDMRGICVTSGSSCHSGASQSISHVIQAIDKTRVTRANLRISLGQDSNIDEINQLIKSLLEFKKII